MKAKEFATMYNKAKNDESANDILAKIGGMFIDELFTIIKERNCNKNSACIAVFKELDDKWKAFSRLTSDVNPNGFKIIIRETVPELKFIFDNEYKIDKRGTVHITRTGELK